MINFIRLFGKYRYLMTILSMGFLALCIAACNQEKSESVPGERGEATGDKVAANVFKEPVTIEGFPSWIKRYVNSLDWKSRDRNGQMTRGILEESFNLGRQFMIHNQKPDGNFNYQYDFVAREMDQNDNQVRQAGALWGLALMYQYDQDPRNMVALDKALAFFFDHTREGPVEGAFFIAYPGDRQCQTGTVALVALGIIEYLRTDRAGGVRLKDEYRKQLTGKLNGYLEFLNYMRLDNKHFSESYSFDIKSRSPRSNPYFDGETMLCMIRAAKYLGYANLIPLIEDSAMVMAKHYTIDRWRWDHDSRKTKGFFQWGSMAFWEYQDAGWTNSEVFADCVLALSWWMLHTHRTLERTGNTAYAYEGIIHAYLVAKSRNNQAALNDLGNTIDKGLFKLTSWQVGGPLQSNNEFLASNQTNDPLATGGIMNGRQDARLRIDVTQHQMHAVILALNYVYND